MCNFWHAKHQESRTLHTCFDYTVYYRRTAQQSAGCTSGLSSLEFNSRDNTRYSTHADFSRSIRCEARQVEAATLPSPRHSWPISTMSPLCVSTCYSSTLTISLFSHRVTVLVATSLKGSLVPFANPAADTPQPLRTLHYSLSLFLSLRFILIYSSRILAYSPFYLPRSPSNKKCTI